MPAGYIPERVDRNIEESFCEELLLDEGGPPRFEKGGRRDLLDCHGQV
jgi:hypothetical protein